MTQGSSTLQQAAGSVLGDDGAVAKAAHAAAHVAMGLQAAPGATDMTFKSVTAQLVQPSNTPVVTTQAGAGTGAPAINVQPVVGTSFMFGFEITFGTTPTLGSAFARLTYPTALKLSVGQLGVMAGFGYLTNAVDGSILTTVYALPVSTTVIDLYFDKAPASAAHGFAVVLLLPF